MSKDTSDMTEYDYPDPVSKLLALGDIRGEPRWPDYLSLGLGPEHVPDLIRMTQDEALHWAKSDTDEVWAPVHAWRALAVLQAEEAVEPLVHLLDRIDEYDDDWVVEDLPEAFGVLGPAAIPTLRDYLADASKGLFGRVSAARSLQEIGQRHPASREESVAILAQQLGHSAEMDPTLNGFIISYLVDLDAVETAPLMERVFAAKQVDLLIQGDWEDVQLRLGLIDERRTPSSVVVHLPGTIEPSSSSPERKFEPRRVDKKLGRNDPRWCGSGKKYKLC